MYMRVCVCVYVSVCLCVRHVYAGVYGGRRTLDPLEWELQGAVIHLV